MGPRFLASMPVERPGSGGGKAVGASDWRRL